MKFIEVKPQNRVYHYIREGAAHEVRIGNVVMIGISDSGGHRLTLADGCKFIPACDWTHIEIIADEWTF